MGFFKEYREVTELLRSRHQIIFYAESIHYYQYFEKLISDLLASGRELVYITSDKKDPILRAAPAGITPVYVKTFLGFLFTRLKADVVIMTMTDLGNYLYKRSAAVGKYVYVFHAAVSTHQQYSEKAFFNYDAVLCAGSYQVEELRTVEKRYGLPEKELIPYGYPLFDSIQKINSSHRENKGKNKEGTNILIAPSWFPGCIFDTCLHDLCRQFSFTRYNIVIRSHPEFEKRRKKEFLAITRLRDRYPHLSIDVDSDVTASLVTSDILITDRSGIAFEFAFGTQRPVIFIDTALKEMNKEWRKLGIEPVENSIRNKLGISILPGEVDKILSKISDLEGDNGFAERIKNLQAEMFYHSYEKGPAFISSLLSSPEDQSSSR
jgi:hypothetical protein